MFLINHFIMISHLLSWLTLFLYILPFVPDLSDCLVITDDKEHESSCDIITLRLQGKEKGSVQEYSLDKVDNVFRFSSGLLVVHLSTVTCIFILSY